MTKKLKQSNAGKIYLFLCIFLEILAIGLIPLNLCLISMPEWISTMICVLLAAAVILFFIKTPKKPASKSVLAVTAVLSIGISLFGSFCAPYWNSENFRFHTSYTSLPGDKLLTSAAAKQDLSFAIKYLKKLHPALLKEVPAKIESRYDEVKNILNNTDSISVCALSREIESIFSLLNDGHTMVAAGEEHPRYLKYIPERNEAGYSLVKVNGMTLKELLEKNKSLYSYEVESYGMTLLKNDLSTLGGLKYLEVWSENGVLYTYEDENGNEDSALYTIDDFLPYEEYIKFNDLDEKEENTDSFVSYEIDRDKDLAVMTLNSCIYNQEYCDTVRQMFQEIQNLGLKNVALDLRNNGGGNSMVANEFLRYLNVESYDEPTFSWRWGKFMIPSGNGITQNQKYEDLLFDGNIYLLTSAYTFSSAMDFAQLIKDNHLGTIIGEAPGNTPAGYGEVAMFKLPNSQLYMQISTKEFFRADKSCTDLLVEPDIPCDPSAALDVLYDVLS